MANTSEYGAFIPTTDVFNVSNIDDIDIKSNDFKLFIVRLSQAVNDIANVLNIKDTGIYYEQEFVNGQIWFPLAGNPNGRNVVPRQVYRRVVNVGALTASAVTTTAHNIQFPVNNENEVSFTRIYGVTSDTTNFVYKPIPNASATAADIIEVSVDQTNVYVTAGANITTFDTTYVILEYLKQ